MAHQIVVNLFRVFEGVIAKASLVSYQSCNFLGVMASYDRVVESHLIVGACECIWVLVVELHHLDGVSEGIEREVDALGDRDKLVFLVSNFVAREGCNGLDKLLELLIGL